MSLRRDTTGLLLAAFLVALGLPLIVYAATGWFSRYASDDYCTASIVLERGFVGAQQYWYTTWSGRFAFFGLVSATELGVGAGSVQVLPALALLGSVAAGAWALLPLAIQARWQHPKLAAAVIAELIVFGIFASVPNLGQSLFWQTGVLTYELPLVLLAALSGWVARALVCRTRATPLTFVGCGVLMCLAGGLSETALAVQMAALGLALLAVISTRREPGVTGMLAAGLLGTLLAGAIVTLAPGNGERVTRSDYPGAQVANLLLAATASLRLFGAFTRRFEAEFRPVFVATGLVPFAVGWWVTSATASSCNLRRHVLASVGAAVAIVLGGAVLVWSSFFPSYWVLGFDPPARIELVAQFFIVCAVAALGYVAGQLLSAVPLEGMANAGVRAVVTLAGVLVLLGPLNVAVAAAGQLPNAARFAAMWDRNDALLRQAHEAGGSQTVVVPELPQWWGWDWVGPRTGDFPNACVARYYGVAAVRSEAVSAAPP